ncbi:MAG: hypothetical protein ABI790_11285 [Betaproteobacteria bacterium]
MRQLVRAACLAILPLTMTPSLHAAEFTAKDLAAEESKFAAYSVKNGMRAAFLEFFADSSWLLRPEPVDARKLISGRPDPAIVLDWKSQLTILSASGDLGFSTGPTIVRAKADPKEPASHGQFFSVWQKQKNGAWKVYVDHGISHGPTATPDALPATPLVALDLKAQPPVADARRGEAEQQFITRSANSNVASAYADAITARTRLLRVDQFPIDGTAAIGAYLASQAGRWSWTPLMQGASRANDFAYAVGNYTWQPGEGAARKGQYVRVWMRDASGASAARWTLAAEVLTPEPPPRKK